MGELKVKSRYTAAFQAVGERVSFLENCSSMMSAPRIPTETVEQLLGMCDEILASESEGGQVASHGLVRALDDQIGEHARALGALVKETEALTRQTAPLLEGFVVTSPLTTDL